MKNLTALFLALFLAISCNQKDYDRESLQGKTLQDLLDTGKQDTTKTLEGYTATILKKEFTYEDRKYIAFVVTKSGHKGSHRDAYYDKDNDRWHGFEPCVNFFSSEKIGKEKFRIQFLSEMLTSFERSQGVQFPRMSDALLIPHGLKRHWNIKDFKGEKLRELLTELYAAYQKKFL